LLFIPCVCAQPNENVRQTYKGPDVSPLWELLKDPGAKEARVDVLEFTPAGDSGVTKELADAVGNSPDERATLVQAFSQLKQGYEAEVARDRNLNGVVQETRANPLEKVTYKWTTHFFEGIGETNLVLQPPAATSRDGILGSNSLFPNAYLYTQGDKLEWRF